MYLLLNIIAYLGEENSFQVRSRHLLIESVAQPLKARHQLNESRVFNQAHCVCKTIVLRAVMWQIGVYISEI